MWQEIEEKSKMLDKAIQDLTKNGYDLAMKEKQVIYGYEDIATLRFERDTAQVKYNANQEYINTIKLQIRILESQIQREWGNNK